jgi:predicted esterase
MNGPHQGQPVRTAGVPLHQANAAMVMVHGRGATADSMLTLAPALDMPGFAYLAPQASGNTWYPQTFLAPIQSNEPGITSGMQAIEDGLSQVTAAGIPRERTILLGFSQGACLTLEFAARNARRYGGIAGLSGGVIGPDGTPRDYPGSLEGTPVFLGCSDVDAHVPESRVTETAALLSRMGADVTTRIYPGMGHVVNDDEIAWAQRLIDAAVSG